MAKRKKKAAEPEQTAPPRARKASPKVLIAFGVVAAVAVAAIVVGTRGGSSESATETGPTGSSGTAASVKPLPHAAEVEKLFDGIQQQGNRRPAQGMQSQRIRGLQHRHVP